MSHDMLKRMPYAAALFLFIFTMTLGPNTAKADNTYSMDFERDSTQYLSISDANQTGLDITGDLTIESWIKLESLPGDGTEYAIFSKYNADGNDRGYSFRYGQHSSTYKFYLYASSACTNFSNGSVAYTLSTGTWYHVAMSKSSSTATFYVNGTSVGSTATDATLCNSGASAVIGSAVANDPSVAFDGLIDDVRVWNIARTGTEINDDKSRELYGNETGLVGYWKLNNSLTDTTSNGNDMTNNGSAVSSVDTPFSGFAVSLKVRKSSDESVANSTVLQNDDQLKLALASNKTYIIDGVLFAESTSASPDLTVAFFGQTGVTLRIGYTNDVNEMVLNSGTTSSRISLPANTPTSIHIKGTVVTGATSGDFQLKWAQTSASSASTTVMQGSYLRAEEI